MVHQVKSRSQRRMEKKHAMLLVVLLLGISLVSFFLGIMVGRGGSAPAVATSETVTPPQPVPPPLVEAPREAQPTPVPEPVPEADPKKTALTFFDSLPKGEQPPLGSGINLPPPAQPAAPPAVAAPQSAPATVVVAPVPVAPKPAPAAPASAIPPTASAPTAVVSATVAPPKAAEVSPTALPKAVAQGSYVVQVASFKDLPDAVGLRDRLSKKGYGAYIQAADLGDKGVWQRVMVGPYAGSEAVGQVVDRLKNEERLSGMLKKQ